MPIHSLEITDFRNLRSVTLSPSSSVNWIIGQNGSGKTSVLEAIHLISTGKSFRTSSAKQYVNHNAKKCLVVTTMDSPSDHCLPLTIGIERDSSGGLIARCNGSSIRKLSDLARLFPVVTLLPDSVGLLTGDPSFRREFVDWTMFHVEHSTEYFEVYKNFLKALQSRNHLLKAINEVHARDSALMKELTVWDDQFALWGERLSLLREDFLTKFVDGLYQRTLDFSSSSYEIRDVCFTYMRGWPAAKSLAEVMQVNRSRDIERGTSTIGPHRYDLRVSYNSVLVKDFFSRGQLKHLTSLFKICQAELFQRSHSEGEVIFLFDDAFAELDNQHALSVVSVLRSLGVQVFATSVEAPETKGFSNNIHDKMFHVEHGSIGQMTVPNLREHIQK